MKKKYSIFPFIKNTLTYDKNWQRTWKNPKTKKNKDIDKLSKVFFLVIFFLIISLAFNHNLFRKFYNILKSMSPYPVTIRLLDPPLHEFLPSQKNNKIISS